LLFSHFSTAQIEAQDELRGPNVEDAVEQMEDPIKSGSRSSHPREASDLNEEQRVSQGASEEELLRLKKEKALEKTRGMEGDVEEMMRETPNEYEPAPPDDLNEYGILATLSPKIGYLFNGTPGNPIDPLAQGKIDDENVHALMARFSFGIVSSMYSIDSLARDNLFRFSQSSVDNPSSLASLYILLRYSGMGKDEYIVEVVFREAYASYMPDRQNPQSLILKSRNKNSREDEVLGEVELPRSPEEGSDISLISEPFYIECPQDDPYCGNDDPDKSISVYKKYPELNTAGYIKEIRLRKKGYMPPPSPSRSIDGTERKP